MLVGFCIDYGGYAQIIMLPSTVNGMRKMMNYSGCTLPEGAFEERECLEEREGALEREAGAMAFKQVWLNASRLVDAEAATIISVTTTSFNNRVGQTCRTNRW
jgi:hypothetical protein